MKDLTEAFGMYVGRLSNLMTNRPGLTDTINRLGVNEWMEASDLEEQEDLGLSGFFAVIGFLSDLIQNDLYPHLDAAEAIDQAFIAVETHSDMLLEQFEAIKLLLRAASGIED